MERPKAKKLSPRLYPMIAKREGILDDLTVIPKEILLILLLDEL